MRRRFEDRAGEQVYLYDAESSRGNARFAFKAVRLVNPTDSTLEAGPVTVYGKGRYIGEGLTDAIPPRAAVVVPFALDRQVVVERAGETGDELSRLITLQRGVLTAEVQHVRRTRLTLTSRLRVPGRVYIRPTVAPGWALLASELPSERLGEARLFEVALGAGETRTIELAEATPLTRTLELGADATLAMMQVFVDSARPSAALKRQLTALLAIHRDLIDTAEIIRPRRDHLAEYRVRAAELTAQLHGLRKLRSAAALARNLADKARATSDRIQATTLAVVDAQDRLMLARIRFQDALAELSLPGAAAVAARP